MSIFSKLSLVLLLGNLACKDVTKHKPDEVKTLQTTLDAVKLSNLKEQPVDLKQYKGKTIFINFWATWCKPCLEEMPSIKMVKEILKDENIEFLFASDETSGEIEAFKSRHDYGFNFVKAGNMEELNIMALPTTFIFNPDGELVFSEMGYRKWDDKTNVDLILKIVNGE
jgi:thiol-disulfide isomerase/thioredoxin